MKKHITILGVCVLFITLSLSGCEILEEEKNYITVNISAYCGVLLYNNQGEQIFSKFASYVPVYIEMVKAGGERLRFDREANAIGKVEIVSGSFNLYKEQGIEVIAHAQGGFEDFFEYQAGFAFLSWAEVDAAADFGGTYSWHPNVYIIMRNSTG